MYRQGAAWPGVLEGDEERVAGETEKLVFLVHPNYFWEYEEVIRDLRAARFAFVVVSLFFVNLSGKRDWVKLDEAMLVRWRGLGMSPDTTRRLTDGPSLCLLLQRRNAFATVQNVVEFHNRRCLRFPPNDVIEERR